MDEEQPFRNYARYVDMETGEAVVEWQAGESCFSRKAFVSRTEDVIIILVNCNSHDMGTKITFGLHDTFKEDTKKKREESRIIAGEENGHLLYQVEDLEGNLFGMAGKILCCDGDMSVEKKGIYVTNASTVLIAVKVFGKMDSISSAEKAIKVLEQLPDESYEFFLERHAKLQRKLLHTSAIDITGNNYSGKCNEELLMDAFCGEMSLELCEKMWNYGRYLFISGSDPEQLPYAMYGLWGGGYRLLWSHYMANINIQMMYWQCGCSGYIDYLKAFINYYWNLMADFRENAKQIYGMEGIWVCAGTTPGYGVVNQTVPVIVDWVAGAAWIAQHMYEYYRYTNDEELFREKILPFMLEAATFYENYLVKEDGIYQIIPSVSPENTPGNLNEEKVFQLAHSNPVTRNATMEIAAIKELFQNLLEVAEMAGNIPDKKIQQWEDIVQNLPPYLINEDGAVKEWATTDLDDFYYHRHFSHLYPLFPGKEIEEDSPLWGGFEKAADLRVLGAMSGWAYIARACVYCRLHRGDAAWQDLNYLVKSCVTNSLFTLHNDFRNMGLSLNLLNFDEEDKAPVQLDASAGFVAVVQMMALYESRESLYLLSALPKQWQKGKVEQFYFSGGYVSMSWDCKKPELCVSLYSRKAQVVKVILQELFYGCYLEDSSGWQKITGPVVKNLQLGEKWEFEVKKEKMPKGV